jgi:hypothetical protein
MVDSNIHDLQCVWNYFVQHAVHKDAIEGAPGAYRVRLAQDDLPLGHGCQLSGDRITTFIVDDLGNDRWSLFEIDFFSPTTGAHVQVIRQGNERTFFTVNEDRNGQHTSYEVRFNPDTQIFVRAEPAAQEQAAVPAGPRVMTLEEARALTGDQLAHIVTEVYRYMIAHEELLRHEVYEVGDGGVYVIRDISAVPVIAGIERPSVELEKVSARNQPNAYRLLTFEANVGGRSRRQHASILVERNAMRDTRRAPSMDYFASIAFYKEPARHFFLQYNAVDRSFVSARFSDAHAQRIGEAHRRAPWLPAELWQYTAQYLNPEDIDEGLMAISPVVRSIAIEGRASREASLRNYFGEKMQAYEQDPMRTLESLWDRSKSAHANIVELQGPFPKEQIREKLADPNFAIISAWLVGFPHVPLSDGAKRLVRQCFDHYLLYGSITVDQVREALFQVGIVPEYTRTWAELVHYVRKLYETVQEAPQGDAHSVPRLVALEFYESFVDRHRERERPLFDPTMPLLDAVTFHTHGRKIWRGGAGQRSLDVRGQEVDTETFCRDRLTLDACNTDPECAPLPPFNDVQRYYGLRKDAVDPFARANTICGERAGLQERLQVAMDDADSEILAPDTPAYIRQSRTWIERKLREGLEALW